jgi:hypothetical protein
MLYCLWYYDSHSCSSTLKLEIASTSEMLVPIYQITWRNIPPGRNVNIQRYKKLKFCNPSWWHLWSSMVSQFISYCSVRPTNWEKFYIHCISLSISNHDLRCNIIYYVQMRGLLFTFVLSCLVLFCFVLLLSLVIVGLITKCTYDVII